MVNLFYLLVFWAILSIYTFFLMAWDKKQAQAKKWRISEERFFLLGLLGGSLGVLIAMSVWKHKRQKSSFKTRIYGIILLQAVLIPIILNYTAGWWYVASPF